MDFNSQFDADFNMSLGSLIKYNDGVFKSDKQAKFILSKAEHLKSSVFTPSAILQQFGIDMNAEQYFITINAHMRFADYGRRSVRMLTWFFVLDNAGVVSKHRIRYTEAGQVKPLETELLWSRPIYVNTVVPSSQAPITDAGEFEGTIGERSKFSGKVTSIREFEASKTFHYYDSGIRTVTTIKTEKGTVLYWNAIPDVQEGDEIEFSASVKKHDTHKGINQTTVSRVTKVKVLSEAA